MNEKITFPRLATLLADRSGRSKRFSEDFLREFFALISERLEAGDSVKIKGLGTFRLSRVEPRRSVDVTTGQPMEISGHSKVVFIPSKELADAVNAPFEAFTAIEISDNADLSQLFSKDDIVLQESEEFEDDIATDAFEEATHPDIKEERHLIDEKAGGPDEEEAEDIYVGMPQEVTDDIEETLTEAVTVEEAALIADENMDEEAGYDKTALITDENMDEEAGDDKTAPIADENMDEEAGDDKTAPIADENMDEEAGDGEAAPIADKNMDEEAAEEPEEEVLEASESRRKRWIRTLMISLGAAIFALIATFAIWYIFATNDFNGIFRRTSTADAQRPTEGFVVGKAATPGQTPLTEPAPVEDSLMDSTTTVEEPEVPTAPSDPIVYDTISTTRYLTTMAKAHYGNYNLWPYIYEENKAILGHPDRIKPGTAVVIPKLSKYGVDPANNEDLEKAKKMGVEIYARYGKKI